jgi:hypothetical protein
VKWSVSVWGGVTPKYAPTEHGGCWFANVAPRIDLKWARVRGNEWYRCDCLTRGVACSGVDVKRAESDRHVLLTWLNL